MRLILGILLYVVVALPALAVYRAAQSYGLSEWAALWLATPVFIGVMWWITESLVPRLSRRLRERRTG